MDNPKTKKEKTLLVETMPNTPITLSALQHEVAALKELVMTEIAAVKDGIRIAHEDMVRFPTQVDKTVGNLDRITEVKIAHRHEVVELHIKRIEDRFHWIEKLMIDEKAAQAVNLAAALSSAKELVTVNGLNTTKQIDALALLVNTLGNSLNEKINDVKDRQIRMEGTGAGKETGKGQLIGIILGAGGLIISMIVMLILVYRTVTGK